MVKKALSGLTLLVILICWHPGYAEEDAQSKADIAVANILFDYDFGSEFASYRINEDGFVDLLMASNTPDKIYVEILDRMNDHPDIDGVLASKTGPACKISDWKN